ncbi:MAG: glycoside hydrolase family 3 N-terminal domain-containing protein [Cyclobacteriaceae bacterium]
MLKKVFYSIIFLLLGGEFAFSQDKHVASAEETAWVDSVFKSLSEDQKIGQLFMVAAYSNRDESHFRNIDQLIAKHHIGGLIFFQGGPVRQAQLTNRYQDKASIPLLIAMDGEWGLGMRLDSTISFPRQMTLGAIDNSKLIYQMGAEIAAQFKRLGVHINFAPVVDINSNPKNPVIGTRSFGEDKSKVAEKGLAYMKGLQDNGIMATGKHFPGHGDTGTDSHYTLPVINHSKERMNSVELYPFKELIAQGLQGMMVAHMSIPTYDRTPNKASTLSSSIVTDLLREELGFDGLVFTDALNMKGVTKFYKPGEVDLLALKAGNDVLLFPENVPVAINYIKTALQKKDFKKADLNLRVRKILAAKYRAGLHKLKPVETKGLYKFLNRPQARLVEQTLYEKAVTIARNTKKILPIQVLDTSYFASLTLGSSKINAFQKSLENFTSFTHFNLSKNQRSSSNYSTLLKKLGNFNQVVVSLHGLNNSRSKKYGVNPQDLNFLKQLNSRTSVVVVVFGNPYSLQYFEDFDQVICTYQDNSQTHTITPQIIFGALGASGTLPVTASAGYKQGIGSTIESIERLGYSIPEAQGMDSRTLKKIDGIIGKAIKDKATPGAQILVARKGKVIYEKSYGYFTYDSINRVTNETIYDIASITKVVATLQVLMFLEERDLVNLDSKVSEYLPELKYSNKKDIVIRDILTHQAGLLPYIPFWQKTVDEFGLNPKIYSFYPERNFKNQVAPGLYSITSLQDSLWRWTIDSQLRSSRYKKERYTYKYSDMGFYMLKKLAEEIINQPIEDFLAQNFYQPLGLTTMTYLPLCKFPIERIAPTEEDNYFRNTLVCGMVHDQGAAMFGGIAGHAGLFSTARDLAVLLQMNLQGGSYGGTRYLSPGTVGSFSQKQYEKNRRGLGWDKPETKNDKGPTSRFASTETFGHTGFTGTAVWVDPKFDLIYIFLSNRIHPKANNIKLIKNNTRTKIQDVIYQSIWNFEKERGYRTEHSLNLEEWKKRL